MSIYTKEDTHLHKVTRVYTVNAGKLKQVSQVYTKNQGLIERVFQNTHFFTLTSGTNVVLSQLTGGVGVSTPENLEINIPSGVIIGSSFSTTPALIIGNFHANTTITIVLGGKIHGYGGVSVTNANCFGADLEALDGGAAILSDMDLSIQLEQRSEIYGGGGAGVAGADGIENQIVNYEDWQDASGENEDGDLLRTWWDQHLNADQMKILWDNVQVYSNNNHPYVPEGAGDTVEATNGYTYQRAAQVDFDLRYWDVRRGIRDKGVIGIGGIGGKGQGYLQNKTNGTAGTLGSGGASNGETGENGATWGAAAAGDAMCGNLKYYSGSGGNAILSVSGIQHTYKIRNYGAMLGAVDGIVKPLD